MLFNIISFSCLVIFYPIALAQSLVVDTGSGPVVGQTIDTENGRVDIWRSIPFAKPPLRELRFKLPMKPDPWTETLNVSGIPNSCYQANSQFMANSKIDEDCLYLTVVTPNPRPEKADVMFYLFGGGNMFGSISQNNYDFTTIPSLRNVILVAPQFRVGQFGLLYAGTDDAPGNQLFMDQSLALQWVRENIENFGGDPSKITLAGQASGAISTAFLFASDDYQKAMFLSGSLSNDISKQEPGIALNSFNKLASDLNCMEKSTEDKLGCMQKKPASEILSKASLSWFNYIPDEKNNILPAHEMLERVKKLSKKKIMIGSTRDEAALAITLLYPHRFDASTDETSITESQYRELINGWYFSWLPQEFRDLMEVIYKDWSNPNESTKIRDAFKRLMSDRMFDCGINKFAETTSKSGWDVFRYNFTYTLAEMDKQSPNWTGAFDGVDTGFFIGSGKDYGETNKKLLRYMVDAFANFVINGDPNIFENGTKLDPAWGTFNTDTLGYMDMKPEPVFTNGTVNVRCKIWDVFLPYFGMKLC